MDIIARVEVPVNNSGTCCYYVDCRTEEEIDAAWDKARDAGHSPHIIRLNPTTITPVAEEKPAHQGILFDIEDEEIII